MREDSRADSKQHRVRYDAIARSASPHRRWLQQAQLVPRSIRLCVVAIVAFCAAAGLARGLRDMHDQDKKARATMFPASLDYKRLWSPDRPVRYNNGTHIDNMYAYSRHLANGQEGSVDLFVDQDSGESVVVKQISSVARNEIPAEVLGDFVDITVTWPTEIEAGLLLVEDEADQPYVPVLDYFVLQSPSGWCWTMVSSFVTDGTLLNLAEKERSHVSRTVDEIDRIYRPVVETLLENLQSFHASGLCHGDIKLNNIYVRNTTSWLLGDLGNVRHLDHPWHSTASWTRQNQWHDCQLNDVRRVLKTYLAFLRAASQDEGSFSDDFWHRRSPWSMMFWDFQRHPFAADRMASLSRNLYRPQEGHGGSRSSSNGVQRSDGMAKATERELLCTSIPSNLWFVPYPV